MVGADKQAPGPRLRLAELLASVSLATDLVTGQPPGHALRTCAIATALAEALGLGPAEVRAVHQVALLRFLGCTADSAETAAGFRRVRLESLALLGVGALFAAQSVVVSKLVGPSRRRPSRAGRSSAPGVVVGAARRG